MGLLIWGLRDLGMENAGKELECVIEKCDGVREGGTAKVIYWPLVAFALAKCWRLTPTPHPFIS